MSTSNVIRNLHFAAFTPLAQISSVFSASLSSFSSLFVMTFILRSQSKLRGAYHRIMFFMSFWDFVSSLAIALTTLPMPADVSTVYDFWGKSFGTVGTCEAQAFVILVGSAFTICSNCALNLYYVCTIRFGMTEARFNKIVLPGQLVLAIMISLPFPIVAMEQDLFNPNISYPYCHSSIYPHNCGKEEHVECIRGGGGGGGGDGSSSSIGSEFETFLFVSLAVGFMLILGSLILVIVAVFQVEKAANLRNFVRGFNGMNGNGRERASDRTLPASNILSEEFKKTRATLFQGLMYIGAFLLTWIWVIVFFVAQRFTSEEFPNWPVLDHLRLFFQPLQGFFNAVIFTYSKVWILQNATRAPQSFCQALKRVMNSPDKVPEILLSRIEMVEGMEDESDVGDPAPGDAVVDYDLESVDTPSAGMAVSQNGNDDKNDNPVEDVLKETSAAASPRKLYQWPPPGWSSIFSESSNDDNASKRSSPSHYSTGGLLSWASLSNSKKNPSASSAIVSLDADSLSGGASKNMENSKRSGTSNYSTGGMLSWTSSSDKNPSSSVIVKDGEDSLSCRR